MKRDNKKLCYYSASQKFCTACLNIWHFWHFWQQFKAAWTVLLCAINLFTKFIPLFRGDSLNIFIWLIVSVILYTRVRTIQKAMTNVHLLLEISVLVNTKFMFDLYSKHKNHQKKDTAIPQQWLVLGWSVLDHSRTEIRHWQTQIL